MTDMPTPAPVVLWFSEIDKSSGPQVGGKGANLGEMVRSGFPVPDGFVVTAQAYFQFLDENKLREPIRAVLHKLDVNDSTKLQKASRDVQKIIKGAEMPQDIAEKILTAYRKLGGENSENSKNNENSTNNTDQANAIEVAIRSSATAEDLPEASFAGQQATFLNISGEKDTLKYVQAAWASLFEARAIFYRENQGFDHFKVGIAVPVQKMVQSDVSGVMFSINPVNNDASKVVIEAIWGLGENIVQGSVTPDHYEVEKKGWDVVVVEKVEQTIEMVRKDGETKDYPVPISRQKQRKVSDAHLQQLAKIAVKLQEHYEKPQDIEWAIENDEIYIVQTRPITTQQSVANKQVVSEAIHAELDKLKLILEGEPASPGIVSGIVRYIPTPKQISQLKVGEIMVTEMTTPDFVPAMKKAGGLVTDKGGQTSHAAIVSRELGLPCVVGTGEATKKLKNGQKVTLDGQNGLIYSGELDEKMLGDWEAVANAATTTERLETKTRVYVNLAEPELAATVAQQHVDGLGLLRAEFMIAQLGYHPRKLIHDHKEKLFVRHMVEHISTFCEAFGERPVVYRATDFKTNEYLHLTGGEDYEPEEENPLMGYRGAFRYIHDPRVFDLELEVVRTVREKHKNLWMMVPFVRSVTEMQQVKTLIYNAGLRRSSNFKLWMMAEIPENVIMIEDYLQHGIDGISVGTNDLTMLMLGTDRDNENVAADYDETHPSVLWALERLVRKCRQYKVTVSVCGQAPTTHHSLLQNLVEWGVTSVSVTPDAINSAREIIYETEQNMKKR